MNYRSEKMPITLYYLSLSPPVRAVLLTGNALGVEFTLKEVNLFGLEHLSPEYIKVHIKLIYLNFQFKNYI